MITDHVYRRFVVKRPVACPPGGCAYWNCYRPKHEHADARSIRVTGRWAKAS